MVRGRLRVSEGAPFEDSGTNNGDISVRASDCPAYPDDDNHFSIKVHHSGDFDETMTNYIGGKIDYFDMCTKVGMKMTEYDAMLGELGLMAGTYDLWLLIPDFHLPHGLFPIENEKNAAVIGELLEYSKLQSLYTTPRKEGEDSEWFDFSYTQFEEEETDRRLTEIIQEVGYMTDNAECVNEKAKNKKKKVAPLKTPYRSRKRGTCSMLRGLFTNTEDTPVLLDDEQAEDYSDMQRKIKIAGIGSSGVQRELNDEDGGSEVLGEEMFGNGEFQETNVLINEEFLVDETNLWENDEVLNDEGGERTEPEWEDDGSSSEGMFNSDEERMAVSSCDEDDPQYPEFNENTDMDDPHFKLGMLFISGAVFRAAVRKYAIVNQKGITLKKNLSDRIKWRCIDGCNWKVYGRQQQRSGTFQIKTLYDKHTCTPVWDQKQVSAAWLAEQYEEQIRMNPEWPVAAFQMKVINDLKCNVSSAMVYRAMRKAKENVIGKHQEEYGKVYDFGNEILKVMPSSTVKVMTETTESGVVGMRFKRLYMCLGPLKEGFIHGCRPILGLDGCHLRGPFGGILLTAVAYDPNDGIYPVAWAQVEAENNGSWDWFLELLKADLKIENSGSFTFICDRQKGLVNALQNIFPQAEHRFCAMHLSKNLSGMFPGMGIRKVMWFAAKSCTPYFYKKHMEILKKMSPRAFAWLSAKPISQWSRSGFRFNCKSDTFVNNNCEVFNSAINKYRDMGIISMFKGIQNSCMHRIQKRKRKMEKRNGIYCPNALKILKKSISFASNARPVWNGGSKYLVTMSANGHEIIVDLEQKTCACRRWQLNGIPCGHACACIFFKHENPEDYIHECYKISTFIDVYSHFIEPVNGEPYWEETSQIDRPLPPLRKSQPGRPKKKRDTKNDVVQTREGEPTMLKRTGTSLQCSWCSGWGHNTRTCKIQIIDKQRKKEEEGHVPDASTTEAIVKKPIQCSYCKKSGHSRRGCKTRKQDEINQFQNDVLENEVAAVKMRSSVEIEERRNEALAIHKKKAFEKQQKKREIDSDSNFQQIFNRPKGMPQAKEVPLSDSDFQNSSKRTKNVPTSHVKVSHGGIINHFKPPAQTTSLGIEVENWKSSSGQHFTSLKKLEKAKQKKQSNLSKK